MILCFNVFSFLSNWLRRRLLLSFGFVVIVEFFFDVLVIFKDGFMVEDFWFGFLDFCKE